MATFCDSDTPTLAVAILEQHAKACREALDDVKLELTKYLGPHAIDVIIKCPLPCKAQQRAQVLPPYPPPGSSPEVVERFNRAIDEISKLGADIAVIRKVREYMGWVWEWAYYSPMQPHVGPVISALDFFFNKIETKTLTMIPSLILCAPTSIATPSSPSTHVHKEKEEDLGLH